MSDGAHDPIEAGREAWARIRENGRKSWQDWLTVAVAVQLGRDASMLAAGCKTPFGSHYVKAMAEWLAKAQLHGVGVQVRSRLMQILEHRAEIEAWRDALPEDKRAKMNHPDSCYFGWIRSMTGKPARAPVSRPDRPSNHQAKRIRELEHALKAAELRVTETKAERDEAHLGSHRQVYWTQDHVARAARAVSESYHGGDVYMIARRALEAAVRFEADLFALIDSNPKQTNQIRKPAGPRQSAAPVALELQA